MSLKLDIGKLKYVKSDAKTTTLQHPAGHTVTLAHNVLSKDNQAALKALSKASQSSQTPLQADEAKHQSNKLADGGEVHTKIGQSYKNPELAEKGRAILKAKHTLTPEQIKKNDEFFRHADKTLKVQRKGYAFGGETDNKTQVPAPQTRTDEQDREARLQKVKEGAQQSSGIPSDSPLSTGDWSHIFKAEGGEIESTHHCKYCSGGEMYAEGGKAEKKKAFGSSSSPANKEMREKHMEQIRKFAKSLLALTMQPSGGKINPKTGQRRDDNPELGVDKPDWRSGNIESQANPDAMVHELAHLMLLPKGVGLKKGQELMDKQYAEVQKKHGYMKQKRSQGEIQPMAAENILRRHMGLPAARQSTPVPADQSPRMSVDTNQPAAVRAPQGNKTVDLIRQSRLLSPENRQRIEHVISGKLKFHPEMGWQENPDLLNAKSEMYREEHPQAIKKAMADGGEVDEYDQPDLKQRVHRQSQLISENTPIEEQREDQRQTNQRSMEVNAPLHAQQLKHHMSQTKIDQSYADGGDVEQGPQVGVSEMPDVANVRQTIPRQVKQEAPVSDDKSQIQSIYNSLVTGAGPVPGPQSPSHAQFNPNDPNKAFTFGNNGEAPAQFKPEAWQEAEQIHADRRTDNAADQAGQQQKAAAENIVRERAGLPPKPMPGQDVSPNWVPQMAPGQSSESATPIDPYADMPALEANAPMPQGGEDYSNEANPGSAPNDGQVLQQNAPQQKAGPEGFSKVPPVNTDISTNPQDLYQQGAKQALTGVGAQAQTTGELGQMQAKQVADNVAAQRDAQSAYSNQFQNLNNERMNVINDINNGHINNEHFWTGDKDGNGGHSKIAAGIGMLISGLGSGMSGQQNGAMNYLKYQMDRDMEAQKTNLGQKNNLLSANLQQFGNLRDATTMTKIMQTDILINELQKTAAMANDPIAKAAALQAAGKLQMDLAPRMQTFAMIQAMQDISKTGDQRSVPHMLNTLRVLDPEKAKEMESRYVPGVGLAEKNVPEAMRDRMAAFNTTMTQLKDAINFRQEHPNAPFSLSDRAKAQTLMQNLGNQIRVAEDMGVFKASEAAMMNTMLGKSPADFLANVRTNPKLQEMLRLKLMEQKNLYDMFGLRVPQQPQGDQPARSPNEGKTGTLKDGTPVKMINGTWQKI